MAQTSPVRPTNRRRSLRRKAKTTVRVECREGSFGFGPNLATKVLDVSDKGVRLILERALDVTREVEITVGGYGMKKPLKCVSNIRWQLKLEDGSFCAGIEFQKRISYRDWQLVASAS